MITPSRQSKTVKLGREAVHGGTALSRVQRAWRTVPMGRGGRGLGKILPRRDGWLDREKTASLATCNYEEEGERGRLQSRMDEVQDLQHRREHLCCLSGLTCKLQVRRMREQLGRTCCCADKHLLSGISKSLQMPGKHIGTRLEKTAYILPVCLVVAVSIVTVWVSSEVP